MRRSSGSRHPYIRWEGVVEDDGHVLRGETMAVSDGGAIRNLGNQFFEQFHYRPLKTAITVWKKQRTLVAR